MAYVDVFVMDAIQTVLLEDYIDCLDDDAFGEAVMSQARYLAHLSAE